MRLRPTPFGSGADTKPDASLMARDWDERAHKNAYHYICSDRMDWDPESFFQSGEADYQRLVAPVLARLGFDPRAKTLLEVGCGIGRMTRSFARRFALVLALDISSEMLKRAQALNAEFNNVVWLQGDGLGFPQVPVGSQDFVFSYLVLQHVPTKETALGYVKQMLRVLKPGALFCFQFNGCPSATMNWRGRTAWRLIDRLRSPVFGLQLASVGSALTGLMKWDFAKAGGTWRGAFLPAREVLEAVWAAGGDVAGLVGWDTTMAWCYGRKSAS